MNVMFVLLSHEKKHKHAHYMTIVSSSYLPSSLGCFIHII